MFLFFAMPRTGGPAFVGRLLRRLEHLRHPDGYQTKVLVDGPGGYHFGDDLRLGGPLQLLLAVVVIAGLVLVHGIRGGPEPGEPLQDAAGDASCGRWIRLEGSDLGRRGLKM
jgi:hypothetical protein